MGHPPCGSIDYWRNLGGDTLEEASTSGTMLREYVFFNGQRIARRDVSTNNVFYFLSDHLGTTDLVTNSAGAMPPQMESDYYPYGGEIPITTGIQDQNYKFTGKERDSESGLDNFGARYNASSLGRFMSTDPIIITPVRLADPQRLNLYAYTRNNPLKFIDSDGRDFDLVNDTEEGRKKALATITKNMTDKEAANLGIRQNKQGKYEVYVKDSKAISGKDASAAYKGVTGLIGDHSVVANFGLIGGGLTATFPDLGKVSSWSAYDSVFEPAPGSKEVSVLATQGDLPGGVQVWCCNGHGVYQGRAPDFTNAYHELVGETMKYRAGHGDLLGNPALDSETVIRIENEVRDFHLMPARTGTDHGAPVIPVYGNAQ